MQTDRTPSQSQLNEELGRLTRTLSYHEQMNPDLDQLVSLSPQKMNELRKTVDEAKSMPCEAIFRIINEESRQAVESPVTKVLREGVIVGLANHTLLVRRDGDEIPIDDSGAPIREVTGELRGVVLVFRDFSEYKSAEKILAPPGTSWRRRTEPRISFLRRCLTSFEPH